MFSRIVAFEPHQHVRTARLPPPRTSGELLLGKLEHSKAFGDKLRLLSRLCCLEVKTAFALDVLIVPLLLACSRLFRGGVLSIESSELSPSKYRCIPISCEGVLFRTSALGRSPFGKALAGRFGFALAF